jgi:hypothetical protein
MNPTYRIELTAIDSQVYWHLYIGDLRINGGLSATEYEARAAAHCSWHFSGYLHDYDLPAIVQLQEHSVIELPDQEKPDTIE